MSNPLSSAKTVVFAGTIFLSAFLLFSIEPLMAKRILPWFGGSSAVWATCLVFYQTALLVGYFYALLLTRWAAPRVQSYVHIALLAGSLVLSPVSPSQSWKPQDPSDPAWLILALLTINIGLPFIVLAATSPLLQAWLARAGHQSPYRLFALSNLASLAALLAYPLVIEPSLSTTAQITVWRGLYAVFVAMCALVTWTSAHKSPVPQTSGDFEWIPPWRKIFWFILPACSSMLLLSVTNHLDQNVAPVPLLWVLPLAVYLLSFVVSFGSRKVYRRALWLRLLAFALGVLGYSIYNVNSIEALQVSLPIFLTGLFICCTFCHSELNRIRPRTEDLTTFYLLIAGGGAAGAILVGLVAPSLFSAIYELPLSLVVTAALTILLIWPEGAWPVRLLWIGATAAMIAVVVANVKAYHSDALSLRRSFYGALRVVQSPHVGPQQTRTLFHGIVEHGAQYLLPPQRTRPTTYYGSDSGIGIVLRDCFASPKRVGVVGLGVGTLAAYGQPGDTFRFYEINRQVIDISQSLFFYLRESHAKIDIIEGDARLSLERDTSPPFDVLALDAFSGDAIPTHLLTREALAIYKAHLRPQGVVAFHVSNGYLDLAPVVRQLASDAGFHAALVRSSGNTDDLTLDADWVLVTNNRAVLDNPSILLRSVPISSDTQLRSWTDDYNNLLQILRAPHFK